MAVYTHLNLEELNTIASTYGLGKVESFKLLSGGSENSNFLISTPAGIPSERGLPSEQGQNQTLEQEGLVTQGQAFVITICEQKTLEEASQLARLLQLLKTHGFKSSEVVLAETGSAITLWQGKPVMVKHYLEGKIMEFLPAHLLTALGRELGRLHQIPVPDYLPRQLSYGLEYFQEVADYAAASDFHHWLIAQQAYISPYLTETLPRALIHSDVFFSNVIVNEAETEAIIMDFEEASNYYRLFDLGMTIVGLCRRGNAIDSVMVKALLAGYQEEIELTAVEEGSLQAMTVYAATAMCFWRHRQFNQLQPDPAMFEHYRALQETADFVRSMNEDAFKR
ncbi:MAG: phosphotransferase [Bacteroidota bacterium]